MVKEVKEGDVDYTTNEALKGELVYHMLLTNALSIF